MPQVTRRPATLPCTVHVPHGDRPSVFSFLSDSAVPQRNAAWPEYESHPLPTRPASSPHPCPLLFQKPNPRTHFLMETIPLASTEPQGCWSLAGHGPGGELTSATMGHAGESECRGGRAEGRGLHSRLYSAHTLLLLLTAYLQLTNNTTHLRTKNKKWRVSFLLIQFRLYSGSVKEHLFLYLFLLRWRKEGRGGS